MKPLSSRRWIVLASIAVLLLPAGFAQAQRISKSRHWVGSWATSQQLPEPHNSLQPADLRDTTLRQIVHLSIGGSKLRVRLSNAFGTTLLEFTSVHIARAVSPASAKIDPATDTPLTFSGEASVTIPAGADYFSDPVNFSAPALSDLAITLHLAEPPASQTGHPGSRATSYLIHGDQVSAPDLEDAKKVDHWYWISGVDVTAGSSAASVVTLGDSITDGHGATTNGNDRWPDFLARRLLAAPATRMLGVLNEGIGGNRILLDGLGPNALARFDRDVLAQTGVRYLIILEGVNDLGMLTHAAEVPREQHEALVRRIIAAYQQMILRAHAHGIRVIGATILPYSGNGFYHPDALNEADRQKINQWIRAAGHFDAVVDFDKLMRDPAHPDHLLPAYDCGDHLHPSPAGYRRMADSIPRKFFAP
jgi:lysophospholipase L1-like esterase